MMKSCLIFTIIAFLAGGNRGVQAQITDETITSITELPTEIPTISDVLASSTTIEQVLPTNIPTIIRPVIRIQTSDVPAVPACSPLQIAWSFNESVLGAASTNVLIYVTDKDVDQRGTPWVPWVDPSLALTSQTLPQSTAVFRQRRQSTANKITNVTLSSSHRVLDPSFIWSVSKLPVDRWYQIRMTSVVDPLNPSATVQVDSISYRFWSYSAGDTSCLGSPTTTGASSAGITANPGLQQTGGDGSTKKIEGGQIAGIVIGVVGGSAVIALLFLFMRRRRRADAKASSPHSRAEKGTEFSGMYGPNSGGNGSGGSPGGILAAFRDKRAKDEGRKARKARRAQNSETAINGQPDFFERRTPSLDTTLEGNDAYYTHKKSGSGGSGGSAAELGTRPPLPYQTPHVITSSRPPRARKSSSMTTFTLPYSSVESKEGTLANVGGWSRHPSVRSRRGSESAVGGEEYAMDGVDGWTGPNAVMNRSNTAMGLTSINTSTTPTYVLARDRRSASVPPGASHPKPPSSHGSQEFYTPESLSPTSPVHPPQPSQPPQPKPVVGTKTPTKRKPAPMLDPLEDFPKSIPPYAAHHRDESLTSLASFATGPALNNANAGGSIGSGLGNRRASSHSVFNAFAGAKDGPVHYLIPDMPPPGSGR